MREHSFYLLTLPWQSTSSIIQLYLKHKRKELNITTNIIHTYMNTYALIHYNQHQYRWRQKASGNVVALYCYPDSFQIFLIDERASQLVPTSIPIHRKVHLGSIKIDPKFYLQWSTAQQIMPRFSSKTHSAISFISLFLSLLLQSSPCKNIWILF